MIAEIVCQAVQLLAYTRARDRILTLVRTDMRADMCADTCVGRRTFSSEREIQGRAVHHVDTVKKDV